MTDADHDTGMKQLEMGEANSNNAEYYILRRDEQPDVHCRCYGSTSFVRLENEEQLDHPTIATYHLWQAERMGYTVDKVSREDTVWEKIDRERDRSV